MSPLISPSRIVQFTHPRRAFHLCQNSAIQTKPYQMIDNAFAFRIILSLVTRGTPRSSAVAPMILSMGSSGYGAGNSAAMRVTAAVIGRMTKRVSTSTRNASREVFSAIRDSWRGTPTQTGICRKYPPHCSLGQLGSHRSPPRRANPDSQQARSLHRCRRRSPEAFPQLRRDRSSLDIAADSQPPRIKTEQAILSLFDRDHLGNRFSVFRDNEFCLSGLHFIHNCQALSFKLSRSNCFQGCHLTLVIIPWSHFSRVRPGGCSSTFRTVELNECIALYATAENKAGDNWLPHGPCHPSGRSAKAYFSG